MSDLHAVFVEDAGIGEFYDLVEDGEIVVRAELLKPQSPGPWELECRRERSGYIYIGWRLR